LKIPAINNIVKVEQKILYLEDNTWTIFVSLP